MKLETLYKHLRTHLSESDARYILRKRGGFEASSLITDGDRNVDKSVEEQVLSDLEAVKSGKPLSRIYKEREFWGLDFALSPDTLDPRQDTETLIDTVLDTYKGQNPPENILDIGTGSGCILIALLHEYKNANGVGVDIAHEALQTARKNAETNNVAARASFKNAPWGEGITPPNAEKFDLIVSNPPYIASDVIPNLDENVQKYDPILALDGGKDGLQAYREIFSRLSTLLKRGGKAVFEIGFDQAESVTRLSEESGFSVKGVYRDSAGNPRVVEIFFD